MARYRGPVCRLCRRENIEICFKSERGFSDKCGFAKRGYPPGQHGQSRRAKISEYGIQLREKQKGKRVYGVLEKQFRRYFKMAERQKGITGENLLMLLERRLDNVVYRLNLAASRRQSRQLVTHGHIRINGKKVNIPSYLVSEGDLIELRERSKNISPVLSSLELVKKNPPPSWLGFNSDKMQGKVIAFPRRDEIQFPVNEKLIVELYSK